MNSFDIINDFFNIFFRFKFSRFNSAVYTDLLKLLSKAEGILEIYFSYTTKCDKILIDVALSTSVDLERRSVSVTHKS